MGGKNILPMRELRELLEGLGYEKVQTYIQSGNCIFDAEEANASVISSDVAAVIEQNFSFKPSVLTLSASQLDKAIKRNPFDAESNDSRTIHLFFLAEDARTADKDALEKLKHASEEFVLTKEVFYLFAPDGIGRSKLAAGAEKKIAVSVTARNFRTVLKLSELVKQL